MCGGSPQRMSAMRVVSCAGLTETTAAPSPEPETTTTEAEPTTTEAQPETTPAPTPEPETCGNDQFNPTQEVCCWSEQWVGSETFYF